MGRWPHSPTGQRWWRSCDHTGGITQGVCNSGKSPFSHTPQRQIRWYSVKCTAAPTSREHTQRSRLSEHTHAQRDQLAAVRILLSAALRSFAHVCTPTPTYTHTHPTCNQPKVQFQRYVVAEPHRTPRARYNVAHTLGDIISRLDGVVRGPNMFFFPLFLPLHHTASRFVVVFFCAFSSPCVFCCQASHTTSLTG
jgi:hypothetical protein